VGVFEDHVYIQGSGVLEKDGLIFLYTDGLTEARNKEEEEFGPARLVSYVQEHKEEPAGKLTESTIHNLRENWLGTDQEDDWTLMVIKRGM